MKQYYLLLLLISVSQLVYSQVRISPLLPKPLQVYDSVLRVETYAASDSGAIAGVKASISGRTANLFPSGSNFFFGNISLKDLPTGTLQLKLTATDVKLYTRDTLISIIHNPAPQLIIDTPQAYTVARPFLTIKAHTSSPVKYLKLAFVSDTLTFAGAIDTTLNALAYTGPLYVIAEDSSGRTVSRQIDYIVDVNPLLVTDFIAPEGQVIQDVRLIPNRDTSVFTSGPAGCFIHNTITGRAVRVPFEGTVRLLPNATTAAWLTDNGVFFTGSSPGETIIKLYRYQSGQLSVLGSNITHVSIPREFVSASWIAGGTLSVLQFGNNAIPETRVLDQGVTALHMSGGYVYYNKGNQLFRYAISSSTELLNNGAGITNIPAILSENQDYMFVAGYGGQQKRLEFFRSIGSFRDTVADFGNRPDIQKVEDEFRFYVRRIAYTQLSADTTKVWLYDYDHIPRPVFSGPAGHVILKGLGGDGAVIADNTLDQGTYFIPPLGKPRLLARLKGTVYRKDYRGEPVSDWYLAHANVLFRMRTDVVTSGEVTPSMKDILQNTTMRFTADEFRQHYTGQLDAISITRIPTWGDLFRANGQKVRLTGEVIPASELDSLRYVPYLNIIGADTIRWKGSDGFIFTAADAAITLIMRPKLYVPWLKNKDTLYYNNEPPSKLTILNYPEPKWRTETLVTIDSSYTLPVTDSAFYIAPGNLATGIHQLKVTFRHRLDSASTIVWFRVAEAALLRVEQLAVAAETPVKLRTYPNPFAEQFVVEGLLVSNQYSLSLHDAKGALMLQERITGQQRTTITPPGRLPAGVYFLKVFNIGKNSETAVQLIKAR